MLKIYVVVTKLSVAAIYHTLHPNLSGHPLRRMQITTLVKYFIKRVIYILDCPLEVDVIVQWKWM
jgi:hypothetical protein